ncbi:Calx-beta domain-containing protein [Planctomycetota bacterium]
MEIQENALIISAAGDIHISGQTTATGENNAGVQVSDGAAIVSDGIGANAASITIDGTGSGTDNCEGVEIEDVGTAVVSIDGDITITGESKATGNGNDGVNIDDAWLESFETGSIVITGTAGSGSSSDGVEVDDSVIMSLDGSITITGDSQLAGSSADGVDINDSLVHTHSGAIEVLGTSTGAGSSADGVELAGGALLLTESGAITVTGVGQLDGVYMTGADTEVSSISGAITITGTGGGISGAEGVHITGNQVKVTSTNGDILIVGDSGGDDDGVEINNGALISSTGTGAAAGSLTIRGIGGSGTTDYGIEIHDAGTWVTSIDGNILIQGSSPGGDGVYLGAAATVSSTGTGSSAATITLEGTGGNVSSSEGVVITASGTTITSIDGDIRITGDSGGDDDGVEIYNGALISSTGVGSLAARITVTGIGGAGTTDYGIELDNAGTAIQTIDGAVALNGTSPGGDGVYIGSGAEVSSTGTGAWAATLTVDGTGGGVSSSEGVVITDSGTSIISVDGAILITGDSGGNDDGVEIYDGAVISSVGVGVSAAAITVVGAGGIGTTDYGIDLHDIGTVITSVDGDISLNGTAPGGDGVYLGYGVVVSSTGVGVDAATIIVVGTGGGVSSSEGVYLTGTGTAVTSANGAIQITGNSGGDDDGVEIGHGSVVSSTGTGVYAATITIDGIGGIGSTDYGVEITGVDTCVTAIDGEIRITGTEIVRIGSGAEVASIGPDADITIVANDLSLTGIVNAGAGRVVILPAKAGLTFGLGSTAGSWEFVITDAEFDQIFTTDRIVIGNAVTGAITFVNTVSPAGAGTLELFSSATIGDSRDTDFDFIGSQLILHGRVAPGLSPGMLKVQGDVLFADNSTFEVELDSAPYLVAGEDHDQLSVVGSVNLNDAILTLLGGMGLPVNGHELIIVDNDGSDAVIGTFHGLAEGALVGVNGIVGILSYQGGDGNDVTITGDSSQHGISVVPTVQTVMEGDSGTRFVEFEVVLLGGPIYQDVTVYWEFVDGSATQNVDYWPLFGACFITPPATSTIPKMGISKLFAGNTSMKIYALVRGDTAYELDETFSLKLIDGEEATATIVQGLGTVVILNDDTGAAVVPEISVSNATREEGESGTQSLVFDLNLSESSPYPISLRVSTVDGPTGWAGAKAGEDYVAYDQLLTIPAGQQTLSVSIDILGDTKYESNEDFNLLLSDPIGVTIADGLGIGTILNDDEWR